MKRFAYDTLESTSDQARLLVAANPGEPLLVTAGQQTAGRGRRGRTWQSPRGGAWLSMAWPTQREPADYESVPLVAALATWHALAACEPGVSWGKRLQIKWPNDLLLDCRKVAGILCERDFHAPATPALIVGIGVNANLATDSLPTRARYPATTIRDALGHAVDLPALVDAIARHLGAALTDFERHGFTEATRRAIADRLALRGEAVELAVGERAVRGVAAGIDAHGRLLLRVNGVVERFAVGDVRQVASPAAQADA